MNLRFPKVVRNQDNSLRILVPVARGRASSREEEPLRRGRRASERARGESEDERLSFNPERSRCAASTRARALLEKVVSLSGSLFKNPTAVS